MSSFFCCEDSSSGLWTFDESQIVSINIKSISGLSIFFKCTSISLFTGSTFD
jgi:hypothetical protein